MLLAGRLNRRIHTACPYLRMLVLISICVAAGAADDKIEPRLRLRDTLHQPSGTPMRRGVFRVWENRKAASGRVLELEVVVLPALEKPATPDPVFYVAGGPGQNAAASVDGWARHWMRQKRDIVLVGQRGTGGNNLLQCGLPGSDGDIQGYFEPAFDEDAFRACLKELRQRADLRMYSTPIAMDDLNDLRAALGYEKINLYGGSYGSRAELVYLRRHPETVRCAILNSVAPIAFRNPLYHAEGAQHALDEIFKRCEARAECRKVFGDLRKKFDTVMKRLSKERAKATVRHPRTGEKVEVRISRDAFADGLRIFMYVNYQDVPRIIYRAYEGDFDSFAEAALRRARGLRHSLAFGMLACVTCAEDVARIAPEEIQSRTRDTFLGDGRVRRQMAICEFWPKSELPDDYGDPVRADVPVLLFSGELDSVTPPKWGAEAASHLSKATHVIAPGSHGVGGSCIDSIERAFLEHPDRKPDTSCVDQMRLAGFRAP